MSEDGASSRSEDDRRTRKRRRKEESRGVRHAIKLLSYAALGKGKKIERLLRKHADMDVNAIGADGLSALHQAARFGHTETTALLLRLGADAQAEDLDGNTPAHWAARAHHLATLAELLQACPSLSLESRNAAGESVRQLMQSAVQRTAGAARLQDSPGVSPADSAELDSEEEWQRKLADNAGFDDYEYSTADWDRPQGKSGMERLTHRFSRSFAGPGPGSGAPGAPEDEEAYARRMWESMQRRTAGGSGPTPAAAEAWAKADSAADRQRRAAEAAAERSRKILEEEQARDRAWREAVQRGDIGARRAAYEAKWHVFAATAGPITFADVPWLVEHAADARAVVLHGCQGAGEQRRRLRAELMRWHPDKFTARFGGRLLPADRERVLERVKLTSQMLNSLAARGEGD